jgi:glycerol-3-phosphate dehydrogenase
LTAGDIISTWAGLRPLVADPHGNPSDISRRHEVAMNRPGWWDVTGGKLTTYRLMAEETLDAIARFLNQKNAKCQTAELPLLDASELVYGSGILPPPVSSELVTHFCKQEWARHLDDVMIRRTSWRYYHSDHLEVAAQVAAWMAEELGWSEKEKEDELERYRQRFGSAMSDTAGVAADGRNKQSIEPSKTKSIT